MRNVTMQTLDGAAHGEITFYPIDAPMIQRKEIPYDECDPVDLNPDGTITVAHSESGHNHVIKAIESGKVQCFQMKDDPSTLFLDVSGEAILEHLKQGPDSHGQYKFGAGTYAGRISREGIQGSPGAWRKAMD